jgi:spermidine synthase
MVALLALVFASGFAALVYQVLWQRQLGLLFGNTAHAAAATLAIFFLGLALGSWLWGERAARTRAPLRGYALLELGIAGAGAAYFALYPLYLDVYPGLFRALADWPPLGAALTTMFAAGVLLPPAVLMGGTLPMLAQHLVREARELGRTGTLLYAVNTAGGAAGALAAGFVLPQRFGFQRAYLTAMAISAAVAAIALLLSTLSREAAVAGPSQHPHPDPLPRGRGGRSVAPLAFFSGFATLGLEVLWTRMFAQVLHNSSYSFTLILVAFLIALAFGAGLAHLLCRLGLEPGRALFALLLLAGTAVCLVPFGFHAATHGLEYVASDARWYDYLRAVFAVAALVLLVPGILIGAVFPFLLAVVRAAEASPGRVIGRLIAVNTAGAIAGALVAGFLLLDMLGLWGATKALGLLYFAAAAAAGGGIEGATASTGWPRWAPIAALLLFATLLDPDRLPVVRVDRAAGEVVHAHWESAYGVTAVVQRGKTLRLKMDNYYALGGTGALSYEQTQADLPLVLHARPRSVFILGLGTGITAGAALAHPIESLTAAELVPEVVEASRLYFAKYNGGLFADPRARIVVGDGRALLHAADDRYDVIIADLFIPWQAGAGSLYTREHYETVRDRLAPGGLFAQWLPLYQLSRDEFMVIARTMLEVFPQVTLWRGDFAPERPIVALIGQLEPAPLDPDAVLDNFRRRGKDASTSRGVALALTSLFYAGNLGEQRDRFAGHLINTDDWPVIEFSSPITQREQRGGAAEWFRGMALSNWYDELVARLPLERDPYLARLEAAERDYVDAGRSLFKSKALAAAGDDAQAKALADRFSQQVPFEVYMMFDGDKGRPPNPS